MKNKNIGARKYPKPWLFFSVNKEKQYFLENLTMLLASGLDVLSTLNSLASESKSRGMKRIVKMMAEDIENGLSLYQVVDNCGLFNDQTVSLIRIGEKSGRLIENLELVAAQSRKGEEFKSKILSAMMYPSFVLVITFLVGFGIAWFILPRLSTVFSQMNVDLPTITKIFIDLGHFLGLYGHIVMPAVFFGAVFIFYFLFFFSGTKFIGQYLAFRLPIIKDLMKQTELARMGYVLGSLLDAGLPIIESLESLRQSIVLRAYNNFYLYLLESVEDGNSLQKSFEMNKRTKKLIPISVQQLIVSGEKSGKLSQSLINIGKVYESKIDLTTRNLSVILEPILLIIVWLGVLLVAIAVILPIYSLVGGFNVNKR